MTQTQILVVDDEPGIALLCEKILSKAGYTVKATTNSEDAIQSCQNDSFDLFLVDVRMPDINGFELFPILLGHQSTIPAIVFMTGFGTVETAVKIIRVGATGLILKPFEKNELIETVEQALIDHKLRLDNFYSIRKPQSKLQVFLCHSKKDKDTIRTLYDDLIGEKFIDPWLDEKKLDPGVDWNLEISCAVKESDVVLVCLSKDSVDKRGYIQREIKMALDVADEQPENTIYIIPVRLDECPVPDRLTKWQWVNFFDKGGYEQLIKALTKRASLLSIK